MNDRRSFLKKLTAGSFAGIPAVKSVEVLNATPKDVLVLTFPGHLSQQSFESIAEMMKQQFPDNKCMILADGMELKVIRHDA